jgi:hypothetical protein
MSTEAMADYIYAAQKENERLRTAVTRLTAENDRLTADAVRLREVIIHASAELRHAYRPLAKLSQGIADGLVAPVIESLERAVAKEDPDDQAR